MKFAWLLAALGIVVVSNTFVLTHVARNRASVDSQMELDSRELESTWLNTPDDSRMHLRLHWNNPTIEWQYGTEPTPPAFLDKQHMTELGFDTSAKQTPSATPIRELFVALELNGPAFQRWLRDQEARLNAQPKYPGQESIEKELDRMRRTASRLVSIDVGRDPSALRRKYPDESRVMILRGLVQMVNVGDPQSLRGQIQRLTNEEVFVPEEFHATLPRLYQDPLMADGPKSVVHNAPVTATIKVGENYEPWLAAVRPNTPQKLDLPRNE